MPRISPLKAAKLLARTAGVPGGVHLEIDKHVPIAGGMGGGSADAAATLVACDAMWGTALSKEELHALAAKLGADVPFALSGGTAIGTGRGDRLNPALATGSFHWVLAVAEFGLSTPGVYRELDRRRDEGPVAAVEAPPDRRRGGAAGAARRRPAPARRRAAQRPPAAALASRPARGHPRARRVARCARRHRVGLGATVAFLAEDADSALELQIALSAARLNAVHVHGPVHGARIMRTCRRRRPLHGRRHCDGIIPPA